MFDFLLAGGVVGLRLKGILVVQNSGSATNLSERKLIKTGVQPHILPYTKDKVWS